MKLSILELARSLELPSETLERWIRQGRIPVHRRGDVCHFKKQLLEKWSSEHHLRMILPDSRKDAGPEPSEPNLLTAMQQGGVVYEVAGEDVASCLRDIVRYVPGIESEDQTRLYEGLMERERLMSTGIGRGVAIPHCRSPLRDLIESSMITTGFLSQPVDFGAVDGKLVTTLFLILAPDVQVHLKLLSRLSFCMRDNHFTALLKNKPEEDALFAQIAEFEEKLEKGVIRL